MRYASLGIDIFERSRAFFALFSPTNWRRYADEQNPHKGVSGKVTMAGLHRRGWTMGCSLMRFSA
jgi:hypothetical protein